MRQILWFYLIVWDMYVADKWLSKGERGGSVVECRTPEREVWGSKPTAAVLCPSARHFTPRKYWLITQEALAPSRYDWKLWTGTLSLNKKKKKKKMAIKGNDSSSWFVHCNQLLHKLQNIYATWNSPQTLKKL